MNNVFVPDAQRGVFERVVSTLSTQLGMNPELFKQSYKIMPTVLKLGVFLNTGISSYKLYPRKGADPTAPAGLNLLDQNDFFALDAISLRLSRFAYSAGVYSNPGNYPMLTYADPNYFTGNGTAAGKEWESLQTLINGNLSLLVNNETMVDPTPAQDYFFNPMATYTSSPLAYPQFGGSFEEKGYSPITPQIILDASADNAIQIDLANGAKANIDGSISTATTDSGVRNVLYAFLHGFKVKNLAGSGNRACAA